MLLKLINKQISYSCGSFESTLTAHLKSSYILISIYLYRTAPIGPQQNTYIKQSSFVIASKWSRALNIQIFRSLQVLLPKGFNPNVTLAMLFGEGVADPFSAFDLRIFFILLFSASLYI